MSPGRLQALDDSFDRVLRRHGSSLMGDHAGAGRSRTGRLAPFGVVVVVVIVAAARLVSGASPLPVIVSACAFAVGSVVVVRRTSRLANIRDDTEREKAAERRLRLSSLG
jgi:hypothetical protein